MKYVPVTKTNENKIVGWTNGAEVVLSDVDCIGIQADDELLPEAERKSKHIWIDHCEFFNEDPATVSDKDRYDGLIDAKNNSANITISWCYFHDHSKGSIMGKSGDDKYDRKVTFSHNHFKNIASRLPLLRETSCHLLNNYMTSCANGADICFSSDVYIEGNYFNSMSKPIFGDKRGYATFADNKWVDCNRVPKAVLSEAPGADANNSNEEVLSGGSFKPSEKYSYKADPVAIVPELVEKNTGVGKINTSEYDPTSILPLSDLTPVLNLVSVKDRSINISAKPGTTINIYNLLGSEIYSENISVSQRSLSLPVRNGTYLVKSGYLTHKITVQ